jgi:hypothetical protein
MSEAGFDVRNKPAVKEVRMFLVPFLKKEIDPNEVRGRIGEIEGKLRDNPEWAAVLAEKLFGDLVVDGRRLEAPLGRDQRNVFERISYGRDSGLGTYYPGVHGALIKIVSNGLPRSGAELILKSVFGDDTRGSYPAMNGSLNINTSILESSKIPYWVKEMECFADRKG